MSRTVFSHFFIALLMLILVSMLMLGCDKPAPTPTTPTPNQSSSTSPASAPSPTQSIAAKPAPAGQIVWKMDEMWSTSDQEHIWLSQAADEILQYSDGRLKINLYPSLSLGLNPGTWFSNIKNGLSESALIFVQYAEGEEPAFTVTEVNGIWDNKAQVAQAVEAMIPFKSKVYDEVWGSHFITTVYMPVQVNEVFSNTRELRTLDDFNGFKVRTPSARQQEIFKALGASPQLMKLPDVYMGLKTGVIDGVSSSSRSTSNAKWTEVTKYATTLGMTEAGANDIVINQKAWNALPDDLKQLVNTVFESVHQRSKAMAVNPGVSNYYRRICAASGIKYNDLSAADLAKYKDVCSKIQNEYLATATPRTKQAWDIVRPFLGK